MSFHNTDKYVSTTCQAPHLLRLSPKAQHQFSLAEQHLNQGRHQAALTSFKQALKAVPHHPFIHFRVGIANHLLGLREEAIRWYRKALDLDPGFGEAANNLGKALLELRYWQEAADAFTVAAQLLPDSPVPSASLASALLGLERLDEAESACRTALQKSPNCAESHWNLALILLKQGRFAEGWQEYEWRWQYPAFPSPRRSFPCPVWDGIQSLDGKRILIYAEQGFGDTIQFARFLPQLTCRGATVLFACQPELTSLMAASFSSVMVLPFASNLPDADYNLPLLSLPCFLASEISPIPSNCPYLISPSEQLGEWAARFDTADSSLKIGLAWAGKPKPDPARSIPVQYLDSLTQCSRVSWFSLQVFPGNSSRTVRCRPDLTMIDLTTDINNFADTAAIIRCLDLVISIDTAVAHLAGALGIPTWVLLPTPCDWRWMTDCNDSPWYPAVRLFRQKREGDWKAVIAAVVDQLKIEGTCRMN